VSDRLHTPALGTHWIGGWVVPRTGLDDVESRKILPLPGIELDPLAVQAVASRYTDGPIPALHVQCSGSNSSNVHFINFVYFCHYNIFSTLCLRDEKLINDCIARTVLEDICDKPIRIQSYCAVARLHGV
jgi:hypothetical protein